MIKTAAAFWGLIFVVVTLLFLLSGSVGLALVAGALVASIATFIAWKRCDSVVLDLAEVEAADEQAHARLFNVTAGLCVTLGVAPPSLYVVEDKAMNAMVVGRNSRDASLVVTSGLLHDLTLVELESVIAVELYRVKSEEIAAETLAVTTFGAPLVFAEAAERWQWLQRLLNSCRLPFDRLVASLHPSRAEVEVDIAATQFTRYPPGLASALHKMAGRSVLAMGTPVTAHLWIAPPVAPASYPAVARIHASLDERIAVLQEL